MGQLSRIETEAHSYSPIQPSPPVQLKGRSIPLKKEKQSLICTSQSLYGYTQRAKSIVCIREGQASHSPCLYLLPTIPQSIPFPSPETPIMPIAPAQYHRCHHQAKGKKITFKKRKKKETVEKEKRLTTNIRKEIHLSLFPTHRSSSSPNIQATHTGL